MRTIVTADAQPYVLQEAVATAGLRHGETATVNVRNVDVRRLKGRRQHGRRRAEIRFCQIYDLEVTSRDNKGDGGQIPEAVRMTGIHFPHPGFYNIVGAQLHSNGQIELRGTPQTRVERADQFAGV